MDEQQQIVVVDKIEGFSDSDKLQIIEFYKVNDILWNPQNTFYKNKTERAKCLQVLADEMTVDKGENVTGLFEIN